VYSDTCIIGQEVKRHAAVLSLRSQIHSISNNPILIKAYDKKILITHDVTEKIMEQVRPDILILSGMHPIVFKKAGQSRQISAIIISPEASPGFRLPLKPSLTADTVHYVRKDGAFNLRL
jgi:hypothetical protein